MKKLQWGETPFHRMTPDQLLKAAIRMYDACASAKSALALSSSGQERSLFWTQGTGGEALEKCRQVVDPLEKKYGEESIYRSFYRPGVDLLWQDRPPIYLTSGWAICPVCGQMTAGMRGRDEPDWGRRCAEAHPHTKPCDGILRQLTWNDMKIKETV